VYERDETRYSLCKCGGHFQNPMPTDASIVEHYLGSYRALFPDIEAGKKSGRKRAARVFPHLPSKAGDMLDVGCASGSLMASAKDTGWQVWGVEPDKNTRRNAKKIGSVYDSLAEVDRTFDLVVSVHVLEHVTDPLAFLQQKAALIRQGGEMLTVFPYYNHRPPHLLAMGGEQVRILLDRIGISDVEIVLYDPATKQLRTDIIEEAELPIIRTKTYMDVIVKAVL
jgi:SAM-dependent methyltransferase